MALTSPSSTASAFYCALPDPWPDFETSPFTCTSSSQLSSDSINQWLSYITDIGYTTAHGLVSLAGILVVCASLATTLKRYKRLTASLHWSAFSAFQKSFICLHFAGVSFFVVFLAGFIANVLNYQHAWIVCASISDNIVYLIQIIFFILGVSMSNTDTQTSKSGTPTLLVAVALVYFLPSIVYLSVTWAHVASNFASSNALGSAMKYTSVVIWIFRCAISALALTPGREFRNGEDGIQDLIRGTLKILSALTLGTGVLTILFTFNVYCPQLYFQRSQLLFQLQIMDWFYFSVLVLISLFFTNSIALERKMFQFNGDRLILDANSETKVASDNAPYTSKASLTNLTDATSASMSSKIQLSPDRMAYSPSAQSNSTNQMDQKWSFSVLASKQQRREDNSKKNSLRKLWGIKSNSRVGIIQSDVKLGSATNIQSKYSRKGSQFLTVPQPSELTLFEDGKVQRASASPSRTFLLPDAVAFLIATSAFVGLWYDALVGRGPNLAYDTAVLVTFSAIVFVQVGLGVFNDISSKTYRPRFRESISVPLSIGIIAIAVGSVISVRFSPILSSWLWPTGLLLCLSATGKTSSHDKMNPLLESIGATETASKRLRRKNRKGRKTDDAVAPESMTNLAVRTSLAVVVKPSTSNRTPEFSLPPNLTRFLKTASVALVCHCFCLSLFCGMQLPIAATVCLFALLHSIGVTNDVGQKSKLHVGIVNFWVMALVGLAFIVAAAMIPLFTITLARKNAQLETNFDVVFSIADDSVSADSVMSAADFPMQGFYIDKKASLLTMNPKALAKLTQLIQNNVGTLYLEVSPSLSQMKDASSVFCAASIQPSVVFIASDLQTLRNLGTLGVPAAAMALLSPTGMRSPLNSIASDEQFSVNIVPPLTVLMNPWLPTTLRQRNEQLFVTQNSVPYVESLMINTALVLSGIETLATKNLEYVQNIPGLVKTANSRSLPALGTGFGNVTMGTFKSSWNDIPFRMKWGLACGVPSVLALILGIAVFAAEALRDKRRRQQEQQRKQLTAEALWRQNYASFSMTHRSETEVIQAISEKIIAAGDLETEIRQTSTQPENVDPRRVGSIVAECLAAVGWFLFALGFGLGDSNYVYFPSSLMYLFGIAGFPSCVASIPLMKHLLSPVAICAATALTTLSLLGAGHAAHRILLDATPFPFSKLSATGAALYTASKIFSISLCVARSSRVALETENTILALALVTVVGWITSAAGMGRFYVDIGVSYNGTTANHGIGPLGSIICTAVASAAIFLSTWINSTLLIAFAGGLAVAALFFNGGMIGALANDCFTASKYCSSQQLAMFAGSIISVTGLAGTIALRFWKFESDDTKHQKLILKYQSDQRDKTRRKRMKRILDIYAAEDQDMPITPEKDVRLPERLNVFTHITAIPVHWLFWRVFAAAALFGWIFFLGGFGASENIPMEGIWAGTIFTLLSPIAIGSLTLAVARDSRIIANTSFIIFHLLLLSFGGILNASSNYIASTETIQVAIPILMFGSLLFFGISLFLSGTMIYRVKHQYKFFRYLGVRYAVQIISWVILLVGMALQINWNNHDTNGTITAIIASVLCSLSIVIHLIDDNTQVFNPPSTLAYFPTLMAQMSYTIIGCAVINACTQLNECKGDCGTLIISPVFILAGSLGYFVASEVKTYLVLSVGAIWKDPRQKTESTSEESEYSSEDGESSSSSVGKKSRRSHLKDAKETPVPSIPGNVHGLMLCWKLLQSLLKLSLLGMAVSMGIVATGLSSKRPDRSWRPDFTGAVILASTGILATLSALFWFLKGTQSSLNFMVASISLSTTMSGHAIFWGLQYGAVSAEAAIFAGGVGYSISAVAFLTLTMAWSNQKRPDQVSDSNIVPTVFQGGCVIGWLILIITVGIKASSAGIGSVPAFVAALLVMATCPATTFLYWFLSMWDIVQVRSLLVIFAALSIMCSGAVLHQEALDFYSSSDQTRSTRIGTIFALVTVIVSQVMFLVHRARTFTEFKIESGFPLEKSLSAPTLRDDAISWVYTPSSYSSLSTLLKLSLCCLMISWCVYAGALGTFKAGDLYPPNQVHSLFVLATFYAVVGLSGHVFLQWKYFGLVGSISAAVSFSSFGCVMYSAVKSPGSMLIIASALLCAAFLAISTVVLLHKAYPPVSRNEIFAIQHTLLIGVICIGWIGCIAAIGLRRGGGAPAYTLVSVCGLLAIIGLIVEKSRPGVVVHGLLRGSNVFGCIATLASAGTSFSSDAEQIQESGVASIVDIVSSALLTAGASLYLLSVFAYSIQRHADLCHGHSLLHKDDKFGSTLAVTGSAINLAETAEAFGSTATLGSGSDVSEGHRRLSEEMTSSSSLDQQSELVSSQGNSTDSLDSTATASTGVVSKRSSIFERLKAMSSSSFASSQTSGDRKREQKKSSFFDRFKRNSSATNATASRESISTSKQSSGTDIVGIETREGKTLPSPANGSIQPTSSIMTPYNTSANDLGPRDSVESIKM